MKGILLLPYFIYKTIATIIAYGIQVSQPVNSKVSSSLSLTTVLPSTGVYTYFSIIHLSFTYKLNFNCKQTSYGASPTHTFSSIVTTLSPTLMTLLLSLIVIPQQWSRLHHPSPTHVILSLSPCFLSATQKHERFRHRSVCSGRPLHLILHGAWSLMYWGDLSPDLGYLGLEETAQPSSVLKFWSTL